MTITLRDVSLDDAERIYAWKQDPFLQKMALDESYETTVKEQELDIKRSIKSDDSDYQIIEHNKRPIGYVRIDYMDDEHHMVWLRFALGKERGKGHAKKALAQYFDRLFADGVHRIEGEVYAYNTPSQKLLESMGFQKEGVKREAHIYQEKYVDVYVYGLLHKEYPL